ncbi:MAG TPA: transposase, partial [Nitrospirae bacterium]|nr:transposase [Nitrospirota bacterium]
MRKLPFVNDQIYHVFNRGVDKRDIFMDEQDYFRFIHNLFEFNDE